MAATMDIIFLTEMGKYTQTDCQARVTTFLINTSITETLNYTSTRLATTKTTNSTWQLEDVDHSPSSQIAETDWRIDSSKQ